MCQRAENQWDSRKAWWVVVKYVVREREREEERDNGEGLRGEDVPWALRERCVCVGCVGSFEINLLLCVSFLLSLSFSLCKFIFVLVSRLHLRPLDGQDRAWQDAFSGQLCLSDCQGHPSAHSEVTVCCLIKLTILLLSQTPQILKIFFCQDP